MEKLQECHEAWNWKGIYRGDELHRGKLQLDLIIEMIWTTMSSTVCVLYKVREPSWTGRWEWGSHTDTGTSIMPGTFLVPIDSFIIFPPSERQFQDVLRTT